MKKKKDEESYVFSPSPEIFTGASGYINVPNAVYDRVIPSLPDVGSIKAMFFFVRRRFGYGIEDWDRVSYSEICRETRSSRTTAIRAVRTLVKHGLLLQRKTKENGAQKCSYKLNVDYLLFQDSEGDG